MEMYCNIWKTEKSKVRPTDQLIIASSQAEEAVPYNQNKPSDRFGFGIVVSYQLPNQHTNFRKTNSNERDDNST